MIYQEILYIGYEDLGEGGEDAKIYDPFSVFPDAGESMTRPPGKPFLKWRTKQP
jgi:hypothetical protein